MAVFPGQAVPKTIVHGQSAPQVINKETGEMFILVRDDVAAAGRLYLAPIRAQTSMFSVTPDQFKSGYEWYVPVKEREVPVREVENTASNVTPTTQESVDASMAPQQRSLPQVDAGGPAGPFVPFEQPQDAIADTSPPEGEHFTESSTEATAPDVAPKKRGRPPGSKNKTKRRKAKA